MGLLLSGIDIAPRRAMVRPVLILSALIFVLSCNKPGASHSPVKEESYKICSFNIQFLGNSRLRKNTDLVKLMKDDSCTMLVVQEIVAPPDLRLIPGNSYFGKEDLPVVPTAKEPINPQPLVTEFFLEMQKAGFDGFWFSEEDTGPVKKNNNNGSATEWWAVFYKSDIWEKDLKLPSGFLDKSVVLNPTWERVPYAFSFRDKKGRFDFVLISVHLHPGPGAADKRKRTEELQGIYRWIDNQKQNTTEKDFIILGDFNLEDAEELASNEVNFVSLNSKAQWNTNTNINNPKPYDHVFLVPAHTIEVSVQNNFKVLNLITQALPMWDPELPYPGEPYNHNLFRLYFSDHHPVSFISNLKNKDDD
jgi:hypothetical protein